MAVCCSICNKIFSHKSNLNRHKKEVHNAYEHVVKYSFNLKSFKCLEGCKISFSKNNELREHLETHHHFPITCETLEFFAFQEFETWLQKIERTSNVRYRKSRGVTEKTAYNFETIYLDCSRSGIEKKVQKMSARVSAKLDSYCTSQIIMRRNKDSDQCTVKYFSSHYGHETKIDHIYLSKGFRKDVAAKLMMGVSPSHILDSTRNNITKNITRDDLVTRKDINNIKTAFNIDIKDGCRNQNDAVSVQLWVKECATQEYNPIIYFKMQMEEAKSTLLDEKDFCLIYMNKVQVELFQKFGRNIICIDGTHGLNSYDFEMTTVLIIDEFKQGFPIAFLFSNRKDTYIYELFFQKIKAAVGVSHFNCETFMSDITNVYFNAWNKVMGPVSRKLFCSWHVDRAWQQNLNKISEKEKRDWTYKTLKYLQTELSCDTFEKEFSSFLNILSAEKTTENMYIYLKNHYYSNRQEWAYCYRRACGINTNMFLESMHKTIKYTYLNGKKIRRLDKTLHALQKFVRDKILERILKISKGCSNKHLQMIKLRHRTALTVKYDISVIEDNVILLKEANSEHIITKTNPSLCCELKCIYCNICIHMYECSCLDFNIKSTICKHIHYACLNTGNPEENGPKNILRNEQEIEFLAENIETCSTASSKNKIISLAKTLCSNVDKLEYMPEEQTYIYKNLKILTNMGFSSENNVKKKDFQVGPNSPGSSNANIEKQVFFSTKKKSIQRANRKKPTSEEVSIIKGTLSNDLFISTDISNDHDYYCKK